MTHVRQQIRDFAAAALSPGTTYGSRVYKMRSYPLSETIQSAVCIYTTSAAYTRSIMGRDAASRTYDVALNLMVEAFLAGDSATAFDGIDAIAVELETKMLADPTMGGLVKDVLLSGVEQDMNTEGGVAVASVALEFQVRYRVSPTNPEVSLP